MILPRIKSQTFTTSPRPLPILTAALICPGPAIPASLLFFTFPFPAPWPPSVTSLPGISPEHQLTLSYHSRTLLKCYFSEDSLDHSIWYPLSNARAFMTYHLYCIFHSAGGEATYNHTASPMPTWCLARLWEPCKYVLNELTGCE